MTLSERLSKKGDEPIMIKKLSLFPMTRDMCAVVRYASLLQGYGPVAFVYSKLYET